MINSVLIDSIFSVSIAARLPDGSTDTAYSGDITVALGRNPFGASLGGTLTKTAVSGIAVFDDLTMDTVGYGYTLVGDASGYREVESNVFSVVEPAGVVPPVATYNFFTVDCFSSGDWTCNLRKWSVEGAVVGTVAIDMTGATPDTGGVGCSANLVYVGRNIAGGPPNTINWFAYDADLNLIRSFDLVSSNDTGEDFFVGTWAGGYFTRAVDNIAVTDFTNFYSDSGALVNSYQWPPGVAFGGVAGSIFWGTDGSLMNISDLSSIGNIYPIVGGIGSPTTGFALDVDSAAHFVFVDGSTEAAPSLDQPPFLRTAMAGLRVAMQSTELLNGDITVLDFGGPYSVTLSTSALGVPVTYNLPAGALPSIET